MGKWYKILLGLSLVLLGARIYFFNMHRKPVNPAYMPVPFNKEQYFEKMRLQSLASQKKDDPTKPFKDSKKRRISAQMLLLNLDDGAFVRVGLAQQKSSDVLLAMQRQLQNAELTSQTEIEALSQCPTKLDDPAHFQIHLVEAPANMKLFCEPREACEKAVGSVKLKIAPAAQPVPGAALVGDVFDVAWKISACTGTRKKATALKTTKTYVIFQ